MEDNRNSNLDLNDASETAGATAEAEAAGDATLSAREAELERERDNYRDLLLRRSAEFENFRKRTDRDRISQAEGAAADVVA